MVWVSAKERLEFGLEFGVRVWIVFSNCSHTSTLTKNTSDYGILGFMNPRIIKPSDLWTLELSNPRIYGLSEYLPSDLRYITLEHITSCSRTSLELRALQLYSYICWRLMHHDVKISGARIWTHDLWIRKRVCYPLHHSAPQSTSSTIVNSTILLWIVLISESVKLEDNCMPSSLTVS